VNPAKTMLRTPAQRQVVTGLVVNTGPNVPRAFVRRTRAMLHSVKALGVAKAEERLHATMAHRLRPQPPIATVVSGRLSYIRMIKGENDPVYRNLYRQASDVLPSIKPVYDYSIGRKHRTSRGNWAHWRSRYEHSIALIEVQRDGKVS